jgi:UPF0755 protein
MAGFFIVFSLHICHMFRKILFLVVLFLVAAGVAGWYFFVKSTTAFTTDYKIIYIYTNQATPDAVLQALEKDSVITNTKSFNWLAGRMKYWDNIKPGRYKIPQGQSMRGVINQLRSGTQAPIDFVISRKIRQKQDLAKMVSKSFECDSADMMAFLTNKDSLKVFGLDSTNWMTAIIHNTYSATWTWSPSRIFRKLYSEQKAFWEKEDRMDKAEKLGYKPIQIYTLASIVAEETNREEDKLNVASTYLNRLKIGMKLQADPTVKFAMGDFKLNRILLKHLEFKSPYNTYLNAGLPPGPICTVAGSYIDAVLNAPPTDYLYFVANADLEGGSTFNSTYEQHLKSAHEYQDSLTAFLKRKAAKKAKDSADSARMP